MDVMTAIKGRRSVRRFEDKPIGKETLLKLLEAAVWAPSGGNGQTWRFVVVTDEAMMKKIKMVSPGILGGPPVVIVIAQDMALAKHKGGKMGPESLTKMDSAMAAQNIMLAAESLGLGSCWVKFGERITDDSEIVEALELKKDESIVGCIVLGYPDEDPTPPPREEKPLVKWI